MYSCRDTLSSRTSQIKEGLNRLFCLIPYDIVNFQVFRIMFSISRNNHFHKNILVKLQFFYQYLLKITLEEVIKYVVFLI